MSAPYAPRLQALLHEAADEGRIAGENAARFPDVRPGIRRAPIGVVFSDPQLAVVGARFADLKPGSFVTGEVSFEDQGRSRVMLRNRGVLAFGAGTLASFGIAWPQGFVVMGERKFFSVPLRNLMRQAMVPWRSSRCTRTLCPSGAKSA